MKRFKLSFAVLAVLIAAASAFTTTKPTAQAGWYIFPGGVKTFFSATQQPSNSNCLSPTTPVCYEKLNEDGTVVSGTIHFGTYTN